MPASKATPLQLSNRTVTVSYTEGKSGSIFPNIYRIVYSPFVSYRTQFSQVFSYIIEPKKKTCGKVM